MQAHFDTGIFYSEILFKRLTTDDIVEIVTNYLDVNGQILGEITSEIDECKEGKSNLIIIDKDLNIYQFEDDESQVVF